MRSAGWSANELHTQMLDVHADVDLLSGSSSPIDSSGYPPASDLAPAHARVSSEGHMFTMAHVPKRSVPAGRWSDQQLSVELDALEAAVCRHFPTTR